MDVFQVDGNGNDDGGRCSGIGADLGLVVCSMDVKQAFDNVSPESLSLIMKEMDIAPMLAGAIWGEWVGGRYDICFQETRVSEIPFDK